MPRGVLPREDVGLLPAGFPSLLRDLPRGLRKRVSMITGRRSFFEARCNERGYTFDEVRPCVASEDGDMITVDENHPAYPHARPGHVPDPGPGAELKSLLKDWLGITSSPTCSCNAMANKMNKMGADWSESADGLAEILAVMKREHARRKTILPWSDTAASMLVKLACRRARAKR